MLTVEAAQGSDAESFTAHESMLTARSEYFKRAMNGNWDESETRVIKLTDYDPAIFALYLNHVYTKQFPTMMNTQAELQAMEPDMARRITSDEVHQLAHVYVPAERLQDIQARSAVIHVIVHLYNAINGPLPPTRTVELVYKETPKGRPLQHLLAELWAHAPMTVILGAVPHLPKEFLDDLSPLVYRQRLHQRPQVLKLSDYRDMASAS